MQTAMTTDEKNDAIRSIFGEASSADVDSNIADIFGKSSGPIDNKVLLASKKRTIIAKKTDPKTENAVTEPKVSGEEPPAKKQKKVREKYDENDDLEDKYISKLLKDDEEKEDDEEEVAAETKEDSSESDHDSSVGGDQKKSRSNIVKTFDLKKDELAKAESTVFVGNLSTKIINEKKLSKDFRKLFESYGKIRSVRFRSISFNDNLPRKVAFIQKKLDSTNDSANAYIVFENKQDSLKALVLNGTVFNGHHIRVDHLTHPLKEDNKKSVFIGNLDFQEKEENLWKYFEEKIGEGEVENVRIIRDSKTNFGKGFAIIQFKDFANVNKALLLHDKPLTTSDKQRKLRITRCKSMKKRDLAAPSSSKFSQKEKTIIGRGKKILNKSDRTTIGRKAAPQNKKVVIEGERATKGTRLQGIKNGLGKTKKPRIRDRSTKFKNERKAKK